MKTITFILALFFMAMTASVFAEDDVICTFEENPIVRVQTSAGASGFTTANPFKTELNMTDSCGVFFRGNSNNAHAAMVVRFNYPDDVINYKQKEQITIPAGTSKYIHILVNSNTIIRPGIVAHGSFQLLMPEALNLTDGLLDASDLNTWKDLVFKVDAGEDDHTFWQVQFRADQDKAIVVDPLGANTLFPPNTSLSAGSGVVYFDEIIINDDPTPRSINTSVNGLNAVNQHKVYVNERKIIVSGKEGASTATLFNAMGQKLNAKVFDSNCQFDVVNSGIYLVQVNGKTTKVIVQ